MRALNSQKPHHLFNMFKKKTIETKGQTPNYRGDSEISELEVLTSTHDGQRVVPLPGEPIFIQDGQHAVTLHCRKGADFPDNLPVSDERLDHLCDPAHGSMSNRLTKFVKGKKKLYRGIWSQQERKFSHELLPKEELSKGIEQAKISPTVLENANTDPCVLWTSARTDRP